MRAILAAGPNIYPVDVRPGFTLSEVAQQVDSLPGHAGGGFARAAASGAVHSMFSPPGSNNLEGMLGTGNYLVLPGETDTDDPAPTWCTASTRTHRRRASARLRRRRSG